MSGLGDRLKAALQRDYSAPTTVEKEPDRLGDKVGSRLRAGKVRPKTAEDRRRDEAGARDIRTRAETIGVRG